MNAAIDQGATETDAANLSGVHILLVEDSWHIGVALKSLLRAMEAEVAGPVATVADAEQLVAKRVPDVAIVDYNLRGGELAHELIDKLNACGTSVIIVSGYATLPVAPDKAVAILQKPIVEAQLLTVLRSVTGRTPAR